MYFKPQPTSSNWGQVGRSLRQEVAHCGIVEGRFIKRKSFVPTRGVHRAHRLTAPHGTWKAAFLSHLCPALTQWRRNWLFLQSFPKCSEYKPWLYIPAWAACLLPLRLIKSGLNPLPWVALRLLKGWRATKRWALTSGRRVEPPRAVCHHLREHIPCWNLREWSPAALLGWAALSWELHLPWAPQFAQGPGPLTAVALLGSPAQAVISPVGVITQRCFLSLPAPTSLTRRCMGPVAKQLWALDISSTLQCGRSRAAFRLPGRPVGASDVHQAGGSPQGSRSSVSGPASPHKSSKDGCWQQLLCPVHPTSSRSLNPHPFV